MAGQPETSAPLRLASLEITGYRSLRRVSWPADGMGWSSIPPIALVGGANGSGKTTLLEVLHGVVAFMLGWRPGSSLQDAALALLPRGAEQITLTLHRGARPFTLTVSSRRPLAVMSPDACSVWMPPPGETESPEFIPSTDTLGAERRHSAASLQRPGGPSLLYFPTDRTVPFPAAPYKGPGSHRRPRARPEGLLSPLGRGRSPPRRSP